MIEMNLSFDLNVLVYHDIKFRCGHDLPMHSFGLILKLHILDAMKISVGIYKRVDQWNGHWMRQTIV